MIFRFSDLKIIKLRWNVSASGARIGLLVGRKSESRDLASYHRMMGRGWAGRAGVGTRPMEESRLIQPNPSCLNAEFGMRSAELGNDGFDRAGLSSNGGLVDGAAAHGA